MHASPAQVGTKKTPQLYKQLSRQEGESTTTLHQTMSVITHFHMKQTWSNAMDCPVLCTYDRVLGWPFFLAGVTVVG